MKHQLITYIEKINNSYLPVVNKKNFDQRLILNSNSDDLSLEGGMYSLNGKDLKKRRFVSLLKTTHLGW